MKKFAVLIILSNFITSFSQTNKSFDYEKFSNPNPENELSVYFKKNVKKKLLKKARFFKDKKNITLSFFVNQQGEPYNLNITSNGTTEFYTEIKKTFKRYFYENLIENKFDSKNKYFLQIISKKGNKKIFNCSTKIIVEKPPICDECKDLTLYEDIKNCLNLEVKKYFYENANFNILNTIKDDEIELFIQFSVKKSGKLKVTEKSKVPLSFIDETDKVISTFPIILDVNLFNNNKLETLHSFSFIYKKGETPEIEDKETKYNSLYKPSSNNNLSHFFINNLNYEDLKKSNLSRIKNNLTLYFELDENKKASNITTNSRSSSLENKVIEIFKKYPINNLNFNNKKFLERYFIQILKYNNDKVFVHTNSIVGSEKPPIFPGCQNSNNFKAAKQCFSKSVQMHFMKKFDTDLTNNLGLSKGKKRVFIAFIISNYGNITNIKVKAPHPKIKNEVIKVMRQLPKMEPGTRGGEPVYIKYSIPFSLIIN